MADGVPTPTITWKKPDGTEARKVTAIESIADIEMKTDEDFGQYTCEAKNEAGPVDTRTVQVQQISKNNNEIFYYAMKISTGSVPLIVGSYIHSGDQFKDVFLLLCQRITDDCTIKAAYCSSTQVHFIPRRCSIRPVLESYLFPFWKGNPKCILTFILHVQMQCVLHSLCVEFCSPGSLRASYLLGQPREDIARAASEASQSFCADLIGSLLTGYSPGRPP